MDTSKFQGLMELFDVLAEFTAKVGEIMVKNNLTLEDVQSLKTKIKQNPEEYFPNLKA